MKTVRIRMYRQGLGDCFLLTFPRDEGPAHVLIDCGVLKGTEDAQARLRDVAANILETTGGVLDVLIVTHEHWDHVSGFLQAEEIFSCLRVRQIWLAWTEDPRDAMADALRQRKAKALRAVQGAAQRLAHINGIGAQRAFARLDGLLGFFGDMGAAGRQTTARALDWVKSREGAHIVYLKPGEIAQIPGVAAARAYVLGPPRDLALLKKSDPSRAHSEVYELAADESTDLGFLAALETGEEAPADQQPFDSFFRVSNEEARLEPLFSTGYSEPGQAWRQIEHDWLGGAGRLALKLDSDTNNTSLALAFELLPSKRVLLFPGDAQVGNWLSWQSLSWPIAQEHASPAVTVDNLFERTVLYKVGHHGSHNATLRANGLQRMSSPELTAMVPVDRNTARKMDWNMPFPPLWDDLQKRTNGRVLDAERGLPPLDDTRDDRHSPQFTSRVRVNPLWVDYEVDCES